MKISRNIYQQLDGISIEKIIKALLKDGCIRNGNVFINDEKDYDVAIHFHPHKTYPGQFIKNYILRRTRWAERDLKRLKLIK